MKLIVICGITSTNKSELGLNLAKELNTVAINADPLQSYLDFSIATNNLVFNYPEKHYLDNRYLNLFDYNNPFLYSSHLINLIKNLKKNYVVIISGNPFYLQNLIFQNPYQKQLIRNADFVNQYKNYSNQQLHDKLNKIDPAAAKKIPSGNRRHILKALQFNQEFNLNYQYILPSKIKNQFMSVHFIVSFFLDKLNYQLKLQKRIEQMLSNEQLFQETQNLINTYNLNSSHFNTNHILKAVGYNLIYNHMQDKGGKNLLDLKQALFTKHWQIAKKQKTFFKSFLPFNNTILWNENSNLVSLKEYFKSAIFR